MLSSFVTGSHHWGMETGDRVGVAGCGRLGKSVVACLLPEIKGTICVWDPQPPIPSIYPNSKELTASRALTAHFGRFATTSRASLQSISDLGLFHDCDLVIVATDSREPDRLVSARLASLGVPHLIARTDHESARVGPFVIPENTACLNCHDLALAERDASWPTRLLEDTRRVDTVPPAARTWAVSLSTAQCCAWLRNHDAPSQSHTIELVTSTAELRLTRWHRHPTCGCSSSALAS